jgi:hypothetical protein
MVTFGGAPVGAHPTTDLPRNANGSAGVTLTTPGTLANPHRGRVAVLDYKEPPAHIRSRPVLTCPPKCGATPRAVSSGGQGHSEKVAERAASA